ncbi:MAG: hypothetical protein ACR2KJ_03185 [Jatrophihabitans sp.]
MWPVSPFGPITDVMVEHADGHRVLIAPSDEVAEFLAATYRFDEIRVEATTLGIRDQRWSVASTSLQLSLELGRRTTLGQLLATVPRSVARSRWWCSAIDPFAHLLVRGVHTRGTAGGGRREWYAALDLHAVDSVHAEWEGTDLGAVRPVEPPVRFGFGSTPRSPSLTRITTTVLIPSPAG